MVITINDQHRTIFGKDLKRYNNPGHSFIVVAYHHITLPAPPLFSENFKDRFTVPCPGCPISTNSTLKCKYTTVDCPIELVSSKLFIMDKAPINQAAAKKKRLTS